MGHIIYIVDRGCYVKSVFHFNKLTNYTKTRQIGGIIFMATFPDISGLRGYDIFLVVLAAGFLTDFLTVFLATRLLTIFPIFLE